MLGLEPGEEALALVIDHLAEADEGAHLVDVDYKFTICSLSSFTSKMTRNRYPKFQISFSAQTDRRK